MPCHKFMRVDGRRQFLRNSAIGFGNLALTAMAARASAQEGDRSSLPNPVANGVHFPPRAKRVIFLFMWGGPSHVDLFDPKPKLQEQNGNALPGSVVGSSQKSLGTVLASPFRFQRHGQSGIWISELFPRLAEQADRLCVIRSMHTDGSAHGEALLNLHTGQANLVRPSVGAWVSYGLGQVNENLPAFVTISPPRGHGGVQNYGNAFLPAKHQGMAIGSAEIPIKEAKIANLNNPILDRSSQRRQLDLIQALNQQHLNQLGTDSDVEGLIANYELAFRMQTQIPEIMSLDDETQETHRLYGIDQQPTDNFGRQCLLARKLAERGVRYIQVSTDYTWDHHQKVQKGSIEEAAKVDRPIAGLLQDLARRGLLEDTLVIWGAEFGRTPTAENEDGRNHHPQAFTMWMAGGGAKPGLTYGTTDEFGYAPIDGAVHMHDLHATLLHFLGLAHQRLTYRHAGREFRLTDVYGKVVSELMA